MFDESIWQEMFAHAKSESPAECCGIICQDAAGAFTVFRCENVQDKLHAADPEAHPRTSRKAYRMNDLQVMRIQQDTEREGGRMVGIYHSHVDVSAYFSEEDQNAALFDGDPLFPGVVYPVIPVKNGEVDPDGRKVFHWRNESQSFEPLI